MKAIVYTQYGSPDVLQFKDVEKPTPKDNEVLVTIHAASANPADWHTMRGAPFLVRLVNVPPIDFMVTVFLRQRHVVDRRI